MICYLVMGWCIIVKINILPALLGLTGFWLLLAGGIVYTIGAILYGLGKSIVIFIPFSMFAFVLEVCYISFCIVLYVFIVVGVGESFFYFCQVKENFF